MSPGNVPRSPPAVVLVGEALEDVFPGEPPVVGGAPLNVACHLRAFGLIPVLVTRLGLDAAGERLMKFLQVHEIPDTGVQRDPLHPSGGVNVRAEGTRNVFEIPMPQSFDFIEPDLAAEVAVEARPAAVYYGTLAQRHEVSRAAVRRVVHATDARRFCDLNLREPWVETEVLRVSLGCAHILKLSGEELREVVARLEIPVTHDPARALLVTYPIQTLVVTEGEDGARRLERDESDSRHFFESRVPARPPARLVDTVGAGDGFSAVTLLGAVLGWPADVSLARANEFAGALCGVRGAVPDDDAFYEPFREAWEVAA